MRWVADTGPLLHLAEANASHLLPMLGEVVVPPAVAGELSALSTARPDPAHLMIGVLDSVSVQQAEDWVRAGLVHRGEAHALALAREIRADVFLTDDAAARLLASTLGLQARGSLGVVLWLAARRRISAADAARHLDDIARTSLWLAPGILAQAHAALRQMQR